MVCAGITKDPAIQPGERARAIDTFRIDYIASERWIQAENAVREYQIKKLASGLDCFGEMALMLAYLTGYAPEMPLHTAHEIVTKLVEERRHIA